MKKFLFLGPQIMLDDFFQKFQKFGWLQFTSINPRMEDSSNQGQTVAVEDVHRAIRILKKYPSCKQISYEIDDKEKYEIIRTILHTNKEIEEIREKMKLLDADVINVQPLGSFSIDRLNKVCQMSQRNVRFFCIKSNRLTQQKEFLGLIFLHRHLDINYYLYIGKDAFVHSLFKEIKVSISLDDLLIKRKELQWLLSEREYNMHSLLAYLHALEELYCANLNRMNLSLAKKKVSHYLSHSIFGVEAWIPENKVQEMFVCILGKPIFSQEIAIYENEIIPTYLENHGIIRVGQDLVELYDIPSHTDKDPSTWVLFSFAIFFGMIVSDAGYGFIFLGMMVYFFYQLKDGSFQRKRMLKLGFLLSATTIIWGILIASYFGIKLSPNNPLNQFSLLFYLIKQKIYYHQYYQDDTFQEWVKEYPQIIASNSPSETLHLAVIQKDGKNEYKFLEEAGEGILLELAICVGIIHLSFSFMRNLYRNWSGIGWIITMFGAYLFLPKIVQATSLAQYLCWIPYRHAHLIGKSAMTGGIGLVFLLSLIQFKIKGLSSVLKIIELFSDTLSYLRIYALGLASMIMAGIFNDLVAIFGGGLIGWTVMFLGHGLNMVLGIMAGALHGLRLNFLEWYHHSFEGGGKLFRPLKNFIKGA